MSSSEFIESLKKTTTARIGIGHKGTRYPTKALLDFQEHLASSRDAVRREVDEKFLIALRLDSLSSMAKTREEYLMNTRCGRLLDPASLCKLKQTFPSEKATGKDILILCADGLSADAFERNVPEMLPLLLKRLTHDHLSVVTFFVTRARVAILDAIGEMVRPSVGLILIGERPGLGISDSLSAYFEYEPCLKRVESDRNVLSNIHSFGIPPSEAALMLAEALIRVVKLKKSGMNVRFDFA